jgi:acyl carrier protein
MFYAVFEKYGLPRGVIFPTYGLAEHTVYVCSNGEQVLIVDKHQLESGKVVVSHKGTKHTTTLVGCGRPTDSNRVDLKIVDPTSGKKLEENEVGEIWINSPSKAQGYWSLPDRSKEDFEATIADGDNSVGYLRTGDLGFLHKGEIFICGRLKDTIIIRGKNYYPHDIEKTGENFSTPDVSKMEIRKGCSAALGLTIMGNEVVLYIAEVTDQVMAEKASVMKSAELFVERLRTEINNMNGVAVAFMALLPPRTIPKTSSGKIARQWVKKAYFEGKLQYLHVWSNLDSTDYDVAHQDLAVESISPDILHADKIDPTGMPVQFILDQLRQVVANCSGCDVKAIEVKIPMARLGLDSMQGIQLQTQLEAKFTVLLPDELLFDPDTTLTTIANSLVNGGSFNYRPALIEGLSVYEAYAKKSMNRDTYYFKVLKNTLNTLLLRRPWNHKPSASKIREVMTPHWYKEHEIKADIDTLRFPDGIAKKVMPIKWNEEYDFIFYSLQIFGVFFYFPVLAWVVHRYLAIQYVVLFWTVLLVVIFGINHEEWPPAFRGHPSFANVLKYFSYRMIIEAPVSAYEGHTSIYTFGPHGVFGIAPTIQTMINGMVVGEYFHLLGANAIFKVPFYNTLLQMFGFQSVDRKNMTSLLNKGRSVGIIPGGIAEMFVTSDKEETLVVQDRKGFISVGLETGAQIVPCYCFGNTQAFRAYNSPLLESISRMLRMSVILFWGRWGTPAAMKIPMLTVLGKPIVLPKVEKPSPELVNEYHELFLRETRRIYDSYKNTYDWQNHKLVFKR